MVSRSPKLGRVWVIHRVAGNAHTPTGPQPWSAVVKVLGPSRMPGQGFDEVGARRELEVYCSGLLASPQYSRALQLARL